MSNELVPLDDEKDLFETVKEISKSLNLLAFKIDQITSSLAIAEKRNSILLTLEEKTDDNMKRLNDMMLELKGVVAMVRPKVKNTGWYGEELNANSASDQNKINTVEIKLIE